MRIQKYPKPYLSNRDPGNRECESHSELAEIRSLQAAWWYLHPKKLQGPWQERGKERGERRKEEKLARGWHGTAHPSKRLGWAVQVEYVSGLWKFEVWKFENSENALVRRFFP